MAAGRRKALFAQAIGVGWDEARGGFYYTLDWSGAPRIRDRLWWPCCEGIGAAAFLGAHESDASYEDWYRRIWSFAARHFIDRRAGGWRPQLDDSLAPSPAISSASRTSTTPCRPASSRFIRPTLA